MAIPGLASCLVLGKRLGYGREAMPPHNLTLTLIGASLLWVGWFGFNAGSAGAADGRAGMAVLIGLIAGVVCYVAATALKRVMGYDDSLDAFGVHGIGGIVGALLTGVFVSKEISGVDSSLLIQLRGVAVTVVYGFAASYVILMLIDKTIGLRVTEEQEREGLDISLHGESIE